QIVGTNIQWFLSRAVFYTASSKPVVKWYYGVNTDGTDGHMEDEGHANYDIMGLTRCFESGRYGITTAQMTAFANAVYYVMYNTTTTNFSDIVDGTGTRKSSLLPCWWGLVRYLTSPDLYPVLYNTELLNNNDNVTTNPNQFANFMTENNRRYLQSQGKVFQGSYQLVARNSGKTVEVPGASTANGTKVDQWTWGGGNHQQW